VAFTIEDLRDLLEFLRQRPEWRDAVRREVLIEDLLGLPAVVERLAVQMQELGRVVARLSEAQERLTVQMQELGRVVARLDGRVGNLEGWRYERRFNARARVTEIVRRPTEVNLADLDPVLDARDAGRLSESEWKQLLALDFLFKGTTGAGSDAEERLVALEVSHVVDSRDVERAHDRAGILARLGFATVPAVGGRRLTEDAAVLADRLGVRTLLDWTDEP